MHAYNIRTTKPGATKIRETSNDAQRHGTELSARAISRGLCPWSACIAPPAKRRHVQDDAATSEYGEIVDDDGRRCAPEARRSQRT